MKINIVLGIGSLILLLVVIIIAITEQNIKPILSTIVVSLPMWVLTYLDIKVQWLPHRIEIKNPMITVILR